MSKGWVKIHRELFESDLWLAEPFTKGQAWADMIGMANHKDKTIWIRGVELKVSRGQIAKSELTLSKKWKWSRNKVRRFLTWLKREQQIEQQKTNVTSLITLINYDKYQANDIPNDTPNDTPKGHQKDTKRYTNKNVKNVKNVKNKKPPLPPRGENIDPEKPEPKIPLKKKLKTYLLEKISGTSFEQYQKSLLEFYAYRMSLPASCRYKTVKGIDGLLKCVGDLLRSGLSPVDCLETAMQEEWLKPRPEYFLKNKRCSRSEQNAEACQNFIERMKQEPDYEE